MKHGTHWKRWRRLGTAGTEYSYERAGAIGSDPVDLGGRQLDLATLHQAMVRLNHDDNNAVDEAEIWLDSGEVESLMGEEAERLHAAIVERLL